jgi:hypothetical protein
MKIKEFILVFIFFLLSSCNSCKIDSRPNFISPDELVQKYWHLFSVTHSDGITPRYIGTAADTVWFTTGKGFVSGLVSSSLDSIFYSVNGKMIKYAVSNFSYGAYNNLHPPQATDTLIIKPVWNTGYSNYIIAWSLVNNLLVLKIMGATDIETDSLYRGQ